MKLCLFYFQRYNPASAGSLARIKSHRVHNTLRTTDKLYSDCINLDGTASQFSSLFHQSNASSNFRVYKHPSLRCACTLVSIFGCYIGRTQLTVEASAGCWLLSVQQLSTIMNWDRKQSKQFLTGQQVCVRVRDENVNKLARQAWDYTSLRATPTACLLLYRGRGGETARHCVCLLACSFVLFVYSFWGRGGGVGGRITIFSNKL